MKIALASPPIPKSIADGLEWLEKLSTEAAGKQASIVCFPETFIPGYPLEEYNVEARSPEKMQAALKQAQSIAAANNIAIILPMDWYEGGRLLNLAFVVSKQGELLGYQTKNQLDPSEDTIWAPGTDRSMFEVDGLKFGIAICHEGFRYPEATRWAARQGAAIVFHPNCGGSNVDGSNPSEWGAKENPYYEKATLMRAMENTIYFASVNYSFEFPDSASAVVAPNGELVGAQPYRQPGVLVVDIGPEKATGLLAKRFKPQLFTLE